MVTVTQATLPTLSTESASHDQILLFFITSQKRYIQTVAKFSNAGLPHFEDTWVNYCFTSHFSIGGQQIKSF